MKPIKVLFVCHGNICRSPMAEYEMRRLVQESGLQDKIAVASAATSTEELGQPVYPPVRRLLAAKGIDCSEKRARQICRQDYAKYDLIIGMDDRNLRYMHRAFGGDPAGKLRLLMDYTSRPGSVSDPWYTGDFDSAWRDVQEGCRGLLQAVIE